MQFGRWDPSASFAARLITVVLALTIGWTLLQIGLTMPILQRPSELPDVTQRRRRWAHHLTCPLSAHCGPWGVKQRAWNVTDTDSHGGVSASTLLRSY